MFSINCWCHDDETIWIILVMANFFLSIYFKLLNVKLATKNVVKIFIFNNLKVWISVKKDNMSNLLFIIIPSSPSLTQQTIINQGIPKIPLEPRNMHKISLTNRLHELESLNLIMLFLLLILCQHINIVNFHGWFVIDVNHVTMCEPTNVQPILLCNRSQLGDWNICF